MGNETLDLIADLDEEFGKKATVKREREASDKVPEKWNELSEAKRIAWFIQAHKTWKPIAALATRITQECQCCGNSQTMIGTYFIRFKHKSKHTTWDFRMPLSPDHAALPRIIEDSVEQIPECASCFVSNSFQAARTHNLACGCEINMNQTSSWQAAQMLLRQKDLFITGDSNATNRKTAESGGDSGHSHQVDAGHTYPPEFAVARRINRSLDVREEESNHRAGFAGVLE